MVILAIVSIISALLKELGVDDLSDASDLDESEVKSLKDTANSQPNTPRGILKKVGVTFVLMLEILLHF